jgi:hypothetical protein
VRVGLDVIVSTLPWVRTAARRAGERNFLETVAADVRQAVVLREALVHEGVVAVEELHHAPVLAHDVVEVHLGLLLHVVAELVVEIGEELLVRRHELQVADLEPLAREVGNEGVGLG